MQKKRMQILSVIVLMVCAISCKKNTQGIPSTSTTPTITAIDVLSGIPGATVKITGTNFNSKILADTVTFNGAVASVTLVSATQIVVSVPPDATSGKIVLKTNGTTLAYPTDFRIIQLVETTIGGKLSIASIAVDPAGNIYWHSGSFVGKFLPSGKLDTLAKIGNGYTYIGGMAVDAADNIYVSALYDFTIPATSALHTTNDYKIYKITPSGLVTVFAGTGSAGTADGTAATAQFTAPAGIAIDGSGNLYVTDVNVVRKITAAGTVTTFAGSGALGQADGQGRAATFNALNYITADANGNLYVIDFVTTVNSIISTIRKISPSGAVTTIPKYPAPYTSNVFGVGAFAVDATGNFYISARPWAIQPGGDYLYMTTFAGAYGGIYLGGAGNINGEAFDASGNLYVSYQVNYYLDPTSYGYVTKIAFK